MPNTQTNATLPDFSKAKVLVVGDTMLDKYWLGHTARISPEAPVPVVSINEEEVRAGGAANVALNLAHLGCQTSLLSLVGEDAEGLQLEELLKIHSVKTHFIKTKKPTICKLRVLSQHQQLIRLDFENTNPNNQELKALENRFTEILGDCQAVIFSDYAKGTLKQVENLISAAKAKGKIVLVDPKGQDFNRYQQSTLLTPNLSEFEAIMGAVTDEASLVSKGRQLIEQLQLNQLLITRGNKGMSLIQKDASCLHLKARAKSVFDVTGAGDTVIATLAAVLASSTPSPNIMQKATYLANLAASIVVEKVGTAWVHPAELNAVIGEADHNPQGLCDLKMLQTYIAAAKGRKERVVFTNGCFDILHSGHVSYLKQAKSLGDRLVVAVNDDDSVKRLKGKDRPINSVTQRMTVLAALESVDWVIPFSEDTPENLIKAINPDCLVKGGDYKDDQIVGAAHVKQQGGEVKALSFHKGSSTTDIINNILEKKGDLHSATSEEEVRS